jgi:hypothetical protein
MPFGTHLEVTNILNSPPPWNTAGPLFQFSFDDTNLCRQEMLRDLKNINNKKNCGLASNKTQYFTSDYILQEFSILNTLSKTEDLSEEEKTTIEEYRAALTTTVHNHLQKLEHNREAAENNTIRLEKIALLKKIGIWSAFILLMAFEFAPMFIGGLMYAQESISALIPYIPITLPSQIITAIGIGCVCNNCLGGICFVAPILLERMGITYSNKNKVLHTALQKQIEGAAAINNILSRDNNISSTDYWIYANFAKISNNNIKNLKENYPPLITSFYAYIATIIMTAFMSIQNISGSLYMSASAVNWIAGSALTTASVVTNMPMIVAAVAVAFFIPQLAIGYMLRTYSTTNMLDPTAEQHNIIKNNLENFNEITVSQFDKIHDKKLSQELNNQMVAKERPAFISEIKEIAQEIDWKKKIKDTSSQNLKKRFLLFASKPPATINDSVIIIKRSNHKSIATL